jgi:hypothetical protein
MEYGWTLHSGMDQHELLQVLPDSLRTEVLMHVQRNVIQSCTMFQECDKAMCLALDPNAYLPYEVVYEEGDATRDVFFVSRGKFKVVTSTGRALSVLSEGDYFGELSYFDYTRRSASVVAITYGEVYVITEKKLDHILKSFPEYVTVLRRQAASHARVYDKGTFFSSPGIRRKSNLTGDGGNQDSQESDKVVEKKESITPWLDGKEENQLGSISEEGGEEGEVEASLPKPTVSAPARRTSNFGLEEVSLPGAVGVHGGSSSAASSAFEELQLQYKAVSMYKERLRTLYDSAVEEENRVVGHMQHAKLKAQEKARLEDDL